MKVCVQVVLDCEAVGCDEFQYTSSLSYEACGTINEDGFLALIPYQVTVYLYRVHYKSFQFHDVCFLFSSGQANLASLYLNLNVYDLLVLEVLLAEVAAYVNNFAAVLECLCLGCHVTALQAYYSIGQGIGLLL